MLLLLLLLLLLRSVCVCVCRGNLCLRRCLLQRTLVRQGLLLLPSRLCVRLCHWLVLLLLLCLRLCALRGLCCALRTLLLPLLLGRRAPHTRHHARARVHVVVSR